MEKFREFAVSKNNDNATFNYRIGLTTYGEGIVGGQYRNFGFNGDGYNVRDGMMTSQDLTGDESKSGFLVELDGQSLISHWELTDTDKKEEDGVMNVRVSLKHKIRPVEVVVCTKYDGSGCMSRWLEVKNLDTKPVALTRLAPFSGVIEYTPSWKDLVEDTDDDTPYRLGYFENDFHMHEGQFKWHDLHSDVYSFCGRYGRSRYRHPFFVLENKTKGTTYAAQLAYSGGYKFSFDFRPRMQFSRNCCLGIICEIDGMKPLRVLAAGETIVSPELIISMVNGDMDDAINAMHTHVRACVMKKPHGPGCYTEAGCGGNIVTSKEGALRAKNNGFDIVYIDAGWYFPEGEDALGWTGGDWNPDPKRFPNGMKELANYCHEIGIKFGLWMEPERLGSFCPKADEDREKCLKNLSDRTVGGHPKGDKGGLYDLSRPEVAEYIEKAICKMIETTGIDMFRLDFNVDYIAPHCYNMQEGYLESADFRYCEHFQAMFDRIRAKFPNVIFENCASGGGRTDLGCVKYFDHTWVTDNPIAPRCFGITNGMTMCLPPEIVDRLVTTMDAPKFASLGFQLYQLMFVRPTSHFPRETPENPLQLAYFKKLMKYYNEFARPMLPTCKIFHHTPSFKDADPKGIGILEEAAEDGSRAMLGVFALCDPRKTEETVRFKGVNASKKYRVTDFETEESFEVSGYDLKYKGLTVAIKGALTATLFMAREI